MKKVLSWLALAGLAAITACGGGGSGAPGVPPGPGVTSTPAGTSSPIVTSSPSAGGDVAFSIVEPGFSGVNRVRRNIGVPSGVQSVAIVLKSVNGTGVSATSTTLNLAASTSGCAVANGQLTCNLTLSEPVGTDVFLVTTYAQPGAQNAPNGAGYLSAVVLANKTTVAPATLSGTIASVAISTSGGGALVGTPASFPLIVAAKDSNGYTILGTYVTPIALSDTDASGQTSISTFSIADSTAATTVSLKYLGGAMSTPANITATVPGVPLSQIAFSPGSSYPIGNSSQTVAGSQSGSSALDGGAPQPTPSSSINAIITTTTGTSFNGLANLVSIETNGTNGDNTGYYQLGTSGSSSVLGLVGGTGFFSEACSAPYQSAMIVPAPPAWDGLAGTGACTFASPGENGKDIQNADGSFNNTFSNDPTQTFSAIVNSDGSASVTQNNAIGSYIVTIQTPAQNSPTIPVLLQTFPNAIPSPGVSTPAPIATTIPNFYATAGLANGEPTSPLASAKFVNRGAVSLPAACAVPPSILGTSPFITEVDETATTLDPTNDGVTSNFYTSDLYNIYILNGLGPVCTIDAQSSLQFDYDVANYALGNDTTWYADTATSYQYITSNALVAQFAKTRSFARALPAAELALVPHRHDAKPHRPRHAKRIAR